MTAFKNIQVLLTANTTSLQQGLTRSAAQVEAFDRKVKQAGDSSHKSGMLMKAGLAAGATAVAVGLAYASAKAIEFDRNMRNVNSITGLTEIELGKLSDQVVELSTQLPQSAAVLSEGLYDIASSGFTGAEGMKVLESAAAAASAGMTTTAVSGKAITAVLNAYGLGAEDAADVSDTLFQTVNLGVLSFEELAGSIGDVVGIASPLGIEVSELGAAIATMTQQGVSGSESTTLLTNLFTKMIRPSDALKDKLKELGYESGEAMLKANGLRGSMEILREVTGGNVTALMELFPDIQAARGALSLMANDGKTAAEAWDSINDAESRAGATQRTLNEQLKAVSAQMSLAKNRIDAAAISVGTQLLPHLLTLLEVGGDVGGMLRDGLGEAVERLGPTWENLSEILANVWDILVMLGEAVAPVVKTLGGLAALGLIEYWNALSEVLADVTGLLADNEVMVMALATALTVHLMGGLTAVVTKIQVGLVMSLFNALTGIGKLGTAASTLGPQLARGAAIMGAWAVAIGLATIAFEGYQRGANAAKQISEDLNAAMKSGDTAVMADAMHNAQADVASLEAKLASLDGQQRGTFGRMKLGALDVGAAFEEWGIRRELDEASADLQDFELAMQRHQGNVVSALAEIARAGGASTDELITRFGSAEGATAEFAGAQELLKKAGVEVGDSMVQVREKVEAYQRSQSVGKGATEDVVAALGDLADGAKDTETALDDLKSALDRLMGVFLDADAATDAFEASLDDIVAATKEHGTSLDENTEAGRNNRQGVRDMVESLRGQIEAYAAAREGAGQLSERLRVGRDRLIKAAEAAGLNTDEMDELLTRYNLTPELVQTIIEAVGPDVAVAEIQAVQDGANTLANTHPKPTVTVQGVEGAVQKVTELQERLGQLAGIEATPEVKTGGLDALLGSPEGDGPGRGGGGNTLKRVMPFVNQAVGVHVTSTYRTPAQNKAVGGSPTSYHMDRANPAVDIAGNTNSLNRLASRLRAAGGWRELLWQVPGHYDHIHVAHTGGEVQGSWPRMPGDRADERTARLQLGERVLSRAEVAAPSAAGGGVKELQQIVGQLSTQNALLARQLQAVSAIPSGVGDKINGVGDIARLRSRTDH